MPRAPACDRDAAFCCMLVACKVIYNDYPRGEGRRLDGRCARGDSGRHLELQQAIALVTGGRLYMDARALMAVAGAEREGARRAGACCRLVRAVMALEPGAMHAPERTGLLHWLYAQCRTRGRPKDVPEAHFCAELLFAGAAHVYLLFVHGSPVCECGGLAMCCHAVCPGFVPGVQREKPAQPGTGTGCVLGVAAEYGALSQGCEHLQAQNTSGGVVPATPDARSPGIMPATPDTRSPGIVPATPDARSPGIVPATPDARSPGIVPTLAQARAPENKESTCTRPT